MDLKNEYMFDGHFGLERETLRINGDGQMSQEKHPFMGSKNLGRDFCENQLELITPICDSIPSLMSVLGELDEYARNILSARGEYLWLNSNPPRINSADDIPIAKFEDDEKNKYSYRVKLEQRYGKRLMLYSGIHFNFSFSEDFIKSIYDGNCSYSDFKNSLYFRLLKQTFRHSWLLVLLSAASPVYDRSLDADGLSGSGFTGFASLRNGENGYWNKFLPILDYENLDTYISSVNEYIKTGELISEGELYLPVRLKPSSGSSLDALKHHGVNHIELRMFDVNPLSPQGIFQSDLEFAHYFLIYLLHLPDFEFTPELQKNAVRNHCAAAKYDLKEITIDQCSASDAALKILRDMEIYFMDFPNILENIDIQKKKISENERTCVKVYDRLISDFQGNMLEISKNRAAR